MSPRKFKLPGLFNWGLRRGEAGGGGGERGEN